LNQLNYPKTAIDPCHWLLPHTHIGCNRGALRCRLSNQSLLPFQQLM
jgi:hypothetical protein